ncbi:tripartite motif-containing protein 14-like [Archocentrus centrarchus]|uniref:tripartite motif-containing protein 14-like n=1 Tax=Archocentrus centrarchus TaxID=63155 RepID=UPI0011EA2F9E|nr:tripartite motif-containing protein 14-like [Archocentrus centrarchus]
MSLSEKHSEQNNQRETEIREDDELHPEDCKGKDAQVKDLLKTSQMEKRSVSPLTLLKEDLSQFREEVLKVFKDKDANPKTTQAPEKLVNPLTLLKEDLNHFKEDISSAFRIVLSKEREDNDVAAKEDSSNTFKIKAPKAETTDRSIMGLFRRDRTLSKINQQTKDAQEVGKTFSVKTEEQMDNGFRNKNSISTEETNRNVTDRLNESNDCRLDVNVSQEVTERRKTFSETQQRQEVICASETGDQISVNEKEGGDSSVASGEDEDKPSETVQCPPSSRFALFSVGNTNNDDLSELPGGYLWALKNFACYLTLDPNTANSELLLTENSRTATRVWRDIESSSHPERFEHCPQVLCREGLLDKVYWEVEWSGGADIGIAYNNISRNGKTANCLLGHNEWSWTVECSEGIYTPCHNRKRFKSSSPEPFARKVGVYLNWSAGTLSFYCVTQDSMVHIHTFTSTFTEPLYPGFWVWACDGSVSLCHVELEWERVLR